ncbi:hypothetical protein PENTCL1PPCAC_9007, partial [Pristionchus entomophagus]
LPTSRSANMWISVHSDGEPPNFSTGQRLGVGTLTRAKISKSTLSRLSRPYGNCETDSSSPSGVPHMGNYSIERCQQECLQDLARKRCGCVDPLYEKMDTDTFCTSPQHLECLVTLTFDYQEPNSEGAHNICDCKPRCFSTTLDVQLSKLEFPASGYLVALGTQQQREALLNEQGGGREGGGRDDSDDYENEQTTSTSSIQVPSTTTSFTITSSPTSTVTTESTPSSTVTTRSPSTSSSSSAQPTRMPNGCPYIPPGRAIDHIEDYKECKDEMSAFSDSDIIAVRGFPCTSTKKCGSCSLFKNAS